MRIIGTAPDIIDSPENGDFDVVYVEINPVGNLNKKKCECDITIGGGVKPGSSIIK